MLFTFINESSDTSLQWGIASVNIFLVICLAIYIFGIGIRRYPAAVATAEAASSVPGVVGPDNNDDQEKAGEEKVQVEQPVVPEPGGALC